MRGLSILRDGMAKLLSVGPQGRARYIELFCEDCHEAWIAAKFPVSVSTLEAIQRSRCIACGGSNLSVFEESFEDPNG